MTLFDKQDFEDNEHLNESINEAQASFLGLNVIDKCLKFQVPG